MHSQTSALADFEEADPNSQDPQPTNPIVGSFAGLQAMHPQGSGSGSSSSNQSNNINNNYWNPEDEEDEEEEEGDVMMEEDDA